MVGDWGVTAVEKMAMLLLTLLTLEENTDPILNATQHEEERLADSFDNVILQFVNDAMEVEIEN